MSPISQIHGNKMFQVFYRVHFLFSLTTYEPNFNQASFMFLIKELVHMSLSARLSADTL